VKTGCGKEYLDIEEETTSDRIKPCKKQPHNLFVIQHPCCVLLPLTWNVVVEWLTILLRIFEVPVQISARRQASLTEVRGFP
jgi:hypothetical protein